MSAVLTRGIADQHAKAPTYAPEVTTTAREIGEEKVCADVELLMHFVGEASSDREHSSFGPISTADLFQILLNPHADDNQLARAAREFRARYIQAHASDVQRFAVEAMER